MDILSLRDLPDSSRPGLALYHLGIESTSNPQVFMLAVSSSTDDHPRTETTWGARLGVEAILLIPDQAHCRLRGTGMMCGKGW